MSLATMALQPTYAGILQQEPPADPASERLLVFLPDPQIRRGAKRPAGLPGQPLNTRIEHKPEVTGTHCPVYGPILRPMLYFCSSINVSMPWRRCATCHHAKPPCPGQCRRYASAGFFIVRPTRPFFVSTFSTQTVTTSPTDTTSIGCFTNELLSCEI